MFQCCRYQPKTVVMKRHWGDALAIVRCQAGHNQMPRTGRFRLNLSVRHLTTLVACSVQKHQSMWNFLPLALEIGDCQYFWQMKCLT